MKLMIDTNILLDVLQKREPHYKHSSIIWKLCETKQVEGYVSTLTFANIVYIMKQELSLEQIEKVLNNLSLIFTFTDLTLSDLKNAASMKWKDFEDSIQSKTAERVEANYIITRNLKDFINSKVTAYSPEEFLLRFDF
ncbi:MAG: PIN domain-containing protein [Lachnospiraceae bacterium]|nr:PIN domain-containing protein [Lachnospiraceae bacterium]